MATIVEKFFDDKAALTEELSQSLEQALRDGIEKTMYKFLMRVIHSYKDKRKVW